MKNLLLIIFLAISAIVLGQTTTEIKYSFEEKKFENYQTLLSMEQGEFIKIKITDININKYTVRNSMANSAKNAVQLPNIFSDVLSALGGSIAPLSLSIFKEVIEKSGSENQEVTTNLGPTQVSFLDDKITWQVNQKPISGEELECKSKILTEQMKVTKELNNFIESEIVIEKEISAWYFKMHEELNFQEHYERSDFDVDMNIVEDIKEKIFEEKMRINKAFQAAGEYSSCISKIKSESLSKLIETNNTKIVGQIELINKEMDKMLILVSDNTKIKFRKLYEQNFKEKELAYELAPIRIDNGLDTLSLSFYENSTGKLLYVQHLPFPLELNKRSTRFSARVFVSNLGSENYSIYKDSLGVSQIVNENENEGKPIWEYGVSAGINYVSFRDNVDITFGVGIGATYSDRIRPRVMLDTGLVFGEKNQFLISGGCIVGYSEVLSKVFDDNSFVLDQESSVTVSKLNLGFQIGIGYFL